MIDCITSSCDGDSDTNTTESWALTELFESFCNNYDELKLDVKKNCGDFGGGAETLNVSVESLKIEETQDTYETHPYFPLLTTQAGSFYDLKTCNDSTTTEQQQNANRCFSRKRKFSELNAPDYESDLCDSTEPPQLIDPRLLLTSIDDLGRLLSEAHDEANNSTSLDVNPGFESLEQQQSRLVSFLDWSVFPSVVYSSSKISVLSLAIDSDQYDFQEFTVSYFDSKSELVQETVVTVDDPLLKFDFIPPESDEELVIRIVVSTENRIEKIQETCSSAWFTVLYDHFDVNCRISKDLLFFPQSVLSKFVKSSKHKGKSTVSMMYSREVKRSRSRVIIYPLREIKKIVKQLRDHAVKMNLMLLQESAGRLYVTLTERADKQYENIIKLDLGDHYQGFLKERGLRWELFKKLVHHRSADCDSHSKTLIAQVVGIVSNAQQQ